MPKLAVLFVHGVEISDPNYADTAIERLKRLFLKHTGDVEGAEDALVIEAAYWVPAVEGQQDKLLSHTYGPGAQRLYHVLTQLVTKVNAGRLLPLIPLTISALIRRVPGIGEPHWPTAKWAFTHFLGDAIAYQIVPGDDAVYRSIHDIIAENLSRLAEKAGPETPLCVISHSLGTVIMSDHFWDLQSANTYSTAPAGSPSIRAGKTLSMLYTLGCPIPLWALRYPNFGNPIHVPAPEQRAAEPDLVYEWVNYYDPDDIVGFPLRMLDERYKRAVTDDRSVALKPYILGGTPASHILYWHDDVVMDPIAQSLATSWLMLREREQAVDNSAPVSANGDTTSSDNTSSSAPRRHNVGPHTATAAAS